MNKTAKEMELAVGLQKSTKIGPGILHSELGGVIYKTSDEWYMKFHIDTRKSPKQPEGGVIVYDPVVKMEIITTHGNPKFSIEGIGRSFQLLEKMHSQPEAFYAIIWSYIQKADKKLKSIINAREVRERSEQAIINFYDTMVHNWKGFTDSQPDETSLISIGDKRIFVKGLSSRPAAFSFKYQGNVYFFKIHELEGLVKCLLEKVLFKSAEIQAEDLQDLFKAVDQYNLAV